MSLGAEDYCSNSCVHDNDPYEPDWDNEGPGDAK